MTFDCENTQLDDDTFFLFVLWHFRLKEVIRVMSSKKKRKKGKRRRKKSVNRVAVTDRS